MSVNIKTLSGLVKVAGNTILLDGTCSEIQSGTITIPANTAEGNWSTTVTMPTAMTDTDYIVILNVLPVDGSLYTSNANYRYKTTTSFIVHCVTGNVPLPQTIEWYAFRLVELEGYNAIYNKLTNIDSTPTDNSTNLVTSGGVYDAIKNASSVFIGTSSEWESETSKTDYQVAILTDQPNVNAVDSTDGSTTVVANKNLVFKGTLEEWEALTTAEKKTYDEALITNDMDTGEVVDAVTDGDMRAVTSNAVYDAMNNIQTGIATNSGANGGTISWIKTGKVVHVSLDAVGTTDTVTRVLTLATGLPKAFIHPNISHPFGNQFASICTGLDINKSIPVSVDDAGKLWLHRSSVEAFEQLSNCYSGFTYITSE